MKRYLITSAAYTGEAEAVYNDAGTLIKLDCSACNMAMEVMHHFKAQTPSSADNLTRGWKDFNPVVIEREFVVTFDMFWVAYDHKVKRKRAFDLWEKMSKGKQVSAWAAIASYNKYLTKNQWRNKADPDTYLRGEMWESEWK